MRSALALSILNLLLARSMVHKTVPVAVAMQCDVAVAVFEEPGSEGLAHAVDCLGVFPDVPGVVVVAGEVVQRVGVDGLGASQVDDAVAGRGRFEGLAEGGSEGEVGDAGSGLHPIHSAAALQVGG